MRRTELPRQYLPAKGWLLLFPLLLPGLLLADESVFTGPPRQVLDEGAGEGPAWHPRVGLLFSGGGHVRKLKDDGRSEIWRENAGTNGLLFDARGRLLLCEPVLRRVTRLDRDGTLTVLTADYQSARYNQPNDITVDSRGRIYFSDPKYGPRENLEIRDSQGKAVEGVYRIDPDGRVTRIITHEADRPNGLLVGPDDRTLFVADNNNNTVKGARVLWKFELDAGGDIVPDSRKLVHDWGQGRGPDGMAQDRRGNLYVAGGRDRAVPPFETAEQPAGVYVFNPAGKLLEVVRIPRDEVTNCTFGGPDLKTLYVTAGGTLWSLPTRTPGRVAWSTE